MVAVLFYYTWNQFIEQNGHKKMAQLELLAHRQLQGRATDDWREHSIGPMQQTVTDNVEW